MRIIRSVFVAVLLAAGLSLSLPAASAATTATTLTDASGPDSSPVVVALIQKTLAPFLKSGKHGRLLFADKITIARADNTAIVIVLDYSVHNYSVAVICTKMEGRSIALDILHALVAGGVQPHAEQLFLEIIGIQDERGVTGADLVTPTGGVRYDWRDDELHFDTGEDLAAKLRANAG